MTDEPDVVAPLQAAQAATQLRAAMLARRDEMHALHPEITTAGKFAPLMGDPAVEYMIWQLERLEAELTASGLPLMEAFDERERQDAAQPPTSEASPHE